MTTNKFSPKGKVKQVTASILNPENAGLRFIVNVVGQNGKFESKLGLMLAKRWLTVREGYKSWFAGQQNFKLGSINSTPVASDTWAVNLLCEDKTGKATDDTLMLAAKNLGALAKYEHATVHVSNMLTEAHPGLVAALDKHLVEQGVSVYYYNEPTQG